MGYGNDTIVPYGFEVIETQLAHNIESKVVQVYNVSYPFDLSQVIQRILDACITKSFAYRDNTCIVLYIFNLN